MMDNKSKGLFWLLVLGGCVLYFDNKSPAVDSNSVHSSSSSVDSGKIIGVLQTEADLPYAEQQFIKAVHDGHAAYDAAANDMQKGATRPRRAKAICSAIPSGFASGWTGIIYKLSSNSDGKRVLEIQIFSDVWVET